MLLSVFFGKNIHPRLPARAVKTPAQNAPRPDGTERPSFRAAVTVLFLRLHFHQIGLVF